MKRRAADSYPHTLAEVSVLDLERLRSICIEAAEAPGTQELARRSEKFRIRLAGPTATTAETTMLIEKMYSWRGYRGEMDVTQAPNRITLNAEFGGRIFGTITLNLDSPAGLACEEVFPEMVLALRQRGRKLCEFGKFAVETTVRSKRLLATLFHMAYIYAYRLHACTDVLIEVNPRHVPFYERHMDFRLWGEQRLCPRVNAPAVLMRLDLVDETEHALSLRGRWAELPDEKSFYKYFLSPQDEDAVVQRLLERASRQVA